MKDNCKRSCGVTCSSSGSGSGSASNTYTSITNPNTGKLGCQYPFNLTNNDSDENAVKTTCTIDPECVGYYKGKNGWCMATKTLPENCKDFPTKEGYNVWKSKASNYTESTNTVNKAGCLYPFNLTTFSLDETRVKNTCTIDPECVGYYKGASGMCVATKTLPKHCQAFTTTGGYNDFMQKV